MLARLAIKVQSLSGDDARSGDSGDERGGVSSGSPATASAASTRLTISLDDGMEDLQKQIILLVHQMIKIAFPKQYIIYI